MDRNGCAVAMRNQGPLDGEPGNGAWILGARIAGPATPEAPMKAA